MDITTNTVKLFFNYLNQSDIAISGDAIRLTNLNNNLYAGPILVGNKFTFKGSLAVHRPNNLTIVSRNCCFNSFQPHQIDEWVKYINMQFIEGVTIVCLQDFPCEYVQCLVKIGHVIHVVYAIGDNGKLISNIIVAHPYIISVEEFEACDVFYLAENSNLSRDFISGCLITNFNSISLMIGSLYAHFATTVESRRYELKKRQNWINYSQKYTKSLILICGDFNPRTLSSLTNEAPKVKAKLSLLNKTIYYTRLIPFIIFSLFGETALKELKRNQKFGLIFPNMSTMKNKKFAGITIPFDSMGAVMDLVQTNLPFDSVEVIVMPADDLSDHYPVRVTTK